MRVFQLIYVSRAAQSDPDWVLDTVDRIKRFALDRNPAREVTGLLVYGRGRFMQLLEGPEPGVRETFERISRDPRHADVEILCERHFHTRLHPRPSLGVLNLDADTGDPARHARASLTPRAGESKEQWRARVIDAVDRLTGPVIVPDAA